MRKNIFLTTVFFCICFTQLNAQNNSGGKQTLPEGTKIEGNKIIVPIGYTATPIKGKNIVVISKDKAPNLRFSCVCDGKGDCAVYTTKNSKNRQEVGCTNAAGCNGSCDLVMGDGSDITTIPHLTDAPQSEIDKLKWKRVIF